MQVRSGNVCMELKAGHLAQGVNAGVGAARALGQRGFAGDPAQGGLQFALDGRLSRLNLPAAEVGAVVGQGQLPGLREARVGLVLSQVSA